MKLKMNLHAVVAHPYLPGNEKPPDIFVAIQLSEGGAMASALQATKTLAEQKMADPEMPRYAVERVVIPIEVDPVLGIIIFLGRKLLGPLLRARKAVGKWA